MEVQKQECDNCKNCKNWIFFGEPEPYAAMVTSLELDVPTKVTRTPEQIIGFCSIKLANHKFDPAARLTTPSTFHCENHWKKERVDG